MSIRTENQPVRVLYSFPHKLGGPRICNIAWQQVNGLIAAGADVTVFPGVYSKPLRGQVDVRPTLAWSKVRIPYRALGRVRACELHDWIVSRRLERLVGKVDVIHLWPVGALHTLRAAERLGIPTVLERPNAHTRFAYEVVKQECERFGIAMPPGHEHAYNEDILRIEEEEYSLADYLLCPSDFVLRTFVDEGFPKEKLARHQYGFDEKNFYPPSEPRVHKNGLTMLFVGLCSVRKGLHYALEAWLRSPASRDGQFLIAGEFVPGYTQKLSTMLTHPSVRMLGFRSDVPELMRQSDILVLPSVEEGSALVTSEARGSGCVLLVSEASGAYCKHMENGLEHQVGNVDELARHITLLHEDRSLLERLRAASLRTAPEVTWTAAGERLLQVYRDVLAAKQQTKKRQANSSSAVEVF
jgi:glycosyltransferase involved in cell wall biosynthesis